MWKFTTRAVRLVADQAGQSTSEYAIATGGAVIAAIAVLEIFQEWLAFYFYDAAALVSLPIP